ncbi:MAG: hypothetical protein M1821_000246 [Bathelium mastoideum]|nr:MAG: hypothetical protein M1821_000246 [Bathelium mastoideum]
MSAFQSFQIDLTPEDGGGSYRITNNVIEGQAETNRRNMVERGNALAVDGELIDVVHGHLSPEGELATLIVMEFRFSATVSHRRFKHATIKLHFESVDAACDVEVKAIAPWKERSMNPTTRHIESTESIHASIQGGAPIATPSLGGQLGRTTSQDKTDQTEVFGRLRTFDRDSGAKNGASWNMSGNESQSTGVPSMLRTAILVKRTEGKGAGSLQFTAKVDITTSSWEETFKRLTGCLPVDEPIVFDPKDEPIAKDFVNLRDNLSTVNLDEICDIVTTTMLENAVRHEAMKGGK